MLGTVSFGLIRLGSGIGCACGSPNSLPAPLDLQLLIDGKFVDAESGKTFPVVDPRTEEEIFRVAEADKVDVDKYVTRAFFWREWDQFMDLTNSEILPSDLGPQLPCLLPL